MQGKRKASTILQKIIIGCLALTTQRLTYSLHTDGPTERWVLAEPKMVGQAERAAVLGHVNISNLIKAF